MPALRHKMRYKIIGIAAFIFSLILLIKETMIYLNLRNAEMTAKRVNSFQKPDPILLYDMMTMQTHLNNLRLNAKDWNWHSAQHEWNELKTTMEAAEDLHMVKNNVDITKDLDSILHSHMETLGEAIQHHDAKAYQKHYDETLSACIHCHRLTSLYSSSLEKLK